jgi:hypothetical protein
LRVPTSTRTPLIGNPFQRRTDTILRGSDDGQAAESSPYRPFNAADRNKPRDFRNQ